MKILQVIQILAVILSLFIVSTPITQARLSLSPAIGYYVYDEPNVMKIPGTMISLKINLDTILKSHLYLGLEGRTGYVIGRYTSTNSGSIPYTPSYLGNLKSLIGYTTLLNNNPENRGTLYTGLNYRLLINDMSGRNSTLNYYGYLRISNYLAIPFGISFEKHYKSWNLMTQFEYDLFLIGKQYSYLHSNDGGTISNIQHNGYGLNAHILLGKKWKNVQFSFGPYINYWSLKDSAKTLSSVGVTYIEPKNTTLETGLLLNFIF